MNANGRAISSIRIAAADYARFIHAWMRRPRQTASVVPSSRYLGRLMASTIDPAGGAVMELGGGTGALTRAILATGLSPADLEVVEINADFARDLRHRFRGVAIVEERAEAVSAVARAGRGGYQAVISGLPLLAMNRGLQAAILQEAFSLLRDDGAFIQFTYSPKPPVSADLIAELGLRAEKVGHIIRNFPPATVFRFIRD